MHLLIVEDERALCDTIARSLRRSAYSVDCCFDGEAALELLQAERYDLVLLDLNLPKKDGMAVLRTLRQTDRETPELHEIGDSALRIIAIHFPMAAIGITLSTLFQATGHGMYSLVQSVMRQLVVLIPSAYILSKIGGLHIVWWAFPIAEVISFIVSTAFLIKIYKTIISKIPEGKL